MPSALGFARVLARRAGQSAQAPEAELDALKAQASGAAARGERAYADVVGGSPTHPPQAVR